MQNFKIKVLNINEFLKLQHQFEIKYYQTEAGILKASIFNNEIFNAEFIENNESIKIDTINFSSINLVGTPFQIKVWQALLQIPKAKTVNYEYIAQMVGHKKAVRAVANAIGANKISYFIPCHRVIRKNGKLGGYRWGIERKIKLLKSEKVI